MSVDIIRPDLPGLPETVPARMLNEFVYCPRLFHLEWVQQQFATSDDVEEGLYLHRVVDRETGDLPDKSEAWDGRVARSVSLSSPRLGLATRLDLVEDGGDGTVVPVDYKKGHPNRDGRAWPSDRMQSLVQALLLREEGYAVERAEIWYAETRQRVHIAVDDAAMQEITDTVARAWRVASDPVAPPPLRDSPKCAGCSLVGICLPDELEALKTPPRQRRPLKRLMAPVLEGRPVYVTLQGATVGVRSDRLEVRSSGELQASYRLIDVSQVCVFGNVTVSAQGVRALLSRDVPVLWFSYGGWFSGMAEGLPGKNVDLRIAQFRASEEQQLEIARRMISGKIRNSRTMLRRNARAELGRVGDQLKELAIQARQADSPQQLLGIEGTDARLYFASFPAMVGKGSRVDVSDFQENGRTRRPPKDPLNALLSFCYTLLVKDLTVTLSGIGFDPYYGMFHRPRFGRPALALDLAEEFRPLIAESVVLQVLNNGEVGPRDFRSRAGGCMLEASGRKAVLRAYERRLDQEITHPQFGYKASYRRVMDIQARVLGAVMLGELDEYTAMVTR
ncbi:MULTISPECIES: CRISPR-associated endonuclease Cas1 [unclassified Actinomyces]|uniref:CRISPR-associated endonuclease Cas4g/Cas1g n=1 Tax=unclassified Actinomyces TaxID=2609248 RepID=UPI0019000119|nr:MULTISPECIES: CRISPR-associated endonuclease Cas1 [unclassified Actinomyces]